MNETTILLSGNPGAEPDFLATVEPAIPRRCPPFVLPFELVIDEYTREPWSSGRTDDPSVDDDDGWRSCYLVSTDGRDRLAGFMGYLRDRKKAAVARFAAPIGDAPGGGGGGRAVLVVPYDPPPPVPRDDLPEGMDASRAIFVKYLRDENILGRDRTTQARTGQHKSMQAEKTQQQQQQQQPQQRTHNNQTRQERGSQRQQPTGEKVITKPPRPAPSTGKGVGLLGNLLGAQRRTEDHLDMVRAKKASRDSSFDAGTGAAGCINAFRAKVSSDLEAFKNDRTSFSTKVHIELSSLVRSVPPDERDGVTMDVFRFAVYEQVEEVGMDRWVAAREPSEFMDECVITVYKEGHCPKEVLEDMNRGELPDEIKGQARHIVESQSRAVQRKEKKMDERMVKDSTAEDVVVLNTNKRDRRTLEQIQKDLLNEDEEVKRSRFET
ncbi:hypothetical protein ACHAW5_008328 [Stephanodiscus triporus]|uniref:Uncharacterized protein n=1 Tax=Stephanodiscus triporus TaxID=2934178 RepID=A0ABD3PDM2_9STRA